MVSPSKRNTIIAMRRDGITRQSRMVGRGVVDGVAVVVDEEPRCIIVSGSAPVVVVGLTPRRSQGQGRRGEG
jgi:hypothetical protein